MQIDQFVPVVCEHSAVGSEVLNIQNILRKWGYKSRIYTETNACQFPFLENSEKTLNNRIVIYHLCVGSKLAEVIKTLPAKKILRYHNITPAFYYQGIDSTNNELMNRGRKDLQSLSEVVIIS